MKLTEIKPGEVYYVGSDLNLHRKDADTPYEDSLEIPTPDASRPYVDAFFNKLKSKNGLNIFSKICSPAFDPRRLPEDSLCQLAHMYAYGTSEEQRLIDNVLLCVTGKDMQEICAEDPNAQTEKEESPKHIRGTYLPATDDSLPF